MNGMTLAAKIRELESQSSGAPGSDGKIPLVMLSSLSRRDFVHDVSDGATDFSAVLLKPIKPSQLFNVLIEIFDNDAPAVEQQVQRDESMFDDQMGKRLPLRILLAEDNATNRKLGLRLLQRLGYQADSALNGFEVIEMLRRQPYDVVLMDVQMPGMDGLEATRRIAEEWPAGPRPRIVAMTANAMQGDREMCFTAGMDDYISKPIRVEKLIEALKRCGPLSGKHDKSVAADMRTVGEMRGRRNGSFRSGKQDEAASSSAAEPTESAVLDRLRKVTGDDTDFITEMIDTFLEDAPTLLETMQQSALQGNAAELRLAAHSLKSNSAEFGAEALYQVCKEAEAMGRAESPHEAKPLVVRARTEYEKLEAVLRNLSVGTSVRAKTVSS